MTTVTKFYIDLEDAVILLKDIYPKMVKEINKYIKKIEIEKDSHRDIDIYDVLGNEQWISYGSYDDAHFKYSKTEFNSTNIERWPNGSSLLCWHCTRPIISRPIALPYKKVINKEENDLSRNKFYEALDKGNTDILNNKKASAFDNRLSEIFYTIGCFCSYSCAYTWNTYSSLRIIGSKWDREYLLYELYNISGYVGKIPKAPPKELLLKYGGKMTNKEYEECIKLSSNSLISISMPPLVSLSPIIEYKNLLAEVERNKKFNETKKSKQKVNICNINIEEKRKKYKVFRKRPLFITIDHFFAT